MTELMFVGEKGLKEDNVIKTIYDPACGTGGMLTSCKEYITSKNKTMDVVLFGQEINPEIYAICKADMLMKGEIARNIKGPSSTLSNDGLKDNKFDYIISNPPYGTDWEKDQDVVEAEAELGFGGRFGAGLPRKSDGQLLFIQHMISKMKMHGEKSRIAVITNGSPLSNGDAGSGESNIRKWIIENDYLETIIALPDQLFFNTGINTYIWILTNQKSSTRKGKIQLIDARREYSKMRKSLGKKRHEISDNFIQNILNYYISFESSSNVKIFNNDNFGYTKITVERPKQLNYQVTLERLENLYSYSPFRKLSESNNDDLEERFKEEEAGKQKQEDIKQALLTISDKKYFDKKEFEKDVKKVLSSFDLKPKTFINNIVEKLSAHDDTANYVVNSKGDIQPNSELRFTEKIPFNVDIEGFFNEKIAKYYPNAWIDFSKNKIGYEINFKHYFNLFEYPRSLESIKKDIFSINEQIPNLNYSLQKDIKMKDSGITFIGEIPNHWDIRPLKHLANTIPGGTPSTKNLDYWENGNIPWLPSGTVQNCEIYEKDVSKYITEKGLYNSATKYIGPNSALIALTGATCANMGFLNFKATANQSVISIEPYHDSPKFLYYFLLSQREQILMDKSGGAQGGINEDNVKNLKIAHTSKEEEDKIVNFLDVKINDIDNTIENIQKKIELLKEYKSSLIYYTVTGKIDWDDEDEF